MQFCCCASLDHAQAVADAGFDRIALAGSYVAACGDAELDRIQKTLDETGLVCRSLNAFCPAEIKLVGEGYDSFALARYARRLAQNAKRIGVQAVGIGSPNSRKLPEGFDRKRAMRQWETSLQILSDALGAEGLWALAEPLCTLECNWMNTTDEVRAVLDRLKLPNVGMVFDMYHAFVMHEDAAPLRRALLYVREVHIAQFVDGEKHYLRADHAADCAAYFRQLREARYSGEIAVEATYDDLSEALPRSNALLRQWAADGAKEA